MYEQSGLLQEALGIIERVLECEPYNEQLALRLMTLYERTGDRSYAIGFFNEFRSRLASNLDIYPGSAITQKYAELKAAPEAAAPQSPAAAPSGLAVSTYCIPDIPFFWMADTVGKLLAAAPRSAVQQWDTQLLRLLSGIQPAAAAYAGGSGETAASPAATAQAFIQWLTAAAGAQPVTVHILHAGQMDSASKGVLSYLQHESPPGLTLICDDPH